MRLRTFDAFEVPPSGPVGPEPSGGAGIRVADDPGIGGAPVESGFVAEAVEVRVLAPTPQWIDALAGALRAGTAALRARSAKELIGVLGAAGARFLDPADPLRTEALELLPPTSGLSAEMCRVVLDGMAADWSEERLAELVRSELGGPEALDGFVPTGWGRRMAVGPALCAQIVAGSVPGVGVNALLRSLLVKGPTLLKPGRGDIVLPILFARALREADAALADSVAVVYWQGGTSELEAAALRRADVVTAYGSDGTVGEVREHVPVTARFTAYHHRVSVGLVGRDALTDAGAGGTAQELARALSLFDQRGCVSPQLVFVEEGGELSPTDFARRLAAALDRAESELPTGPLTPGDASALHQVRGTAELLVASGRLVVAHGGRAPWTLVLEREPEPLGAVAGRFVRLRPVEDAEDVPALLAPVAEHLQTVGVAGLGSRLEEVAHRLGAAGASRIVPFAEVAFPPPWWHHDGRGPLRELTRWVDLAGE